MELRRSARRFQRSAEAHTLSAPARFPHRSVLSSSVQAFDRPMHPGDKRLFIGGEVTVRRTLLMRTGLVAVLFLSVVLIFWLDRDGLRDQIDGHISLTDVVYFSMVTVTTVGYGDIVPVSDRARIVDALLVTPIRLFIWLIFLGTAYQLVLQRFIEDLRMRIMQAKLSDHVVICGFGHGGFSAAKEMVARGVPPRQILVIDSDRAAVERAAECGHVGILGDAAHEDVLGQAMLDSAQAVLVCTGRDDTSVLIVLTVRHLCPGIRIVAAVQEEENDKLVRQSGANATVLPSKMGGLLLADSLQTSALASYVMDLITVGGRVALIEREAREEDVGRLPRDIDDGLVVRIHRKGRNVGFWEADSRIEAGDRLVVIKPQAGAVPRAG